MKRGTRRLITTALFAACVATTASCAADDRQADLRQAVDATIQPVIAKNSIAGMAVGIVVGDKHYVFNYGVASTETKQPVTDDTLFELGSVSKTLTATLASYAQVSGDLSLSDPTGKYVPALRESKFGAVSLLELGTHTPGGFPLQVPDDVKDNEQLIGYLKQWQPTYEPGTYRTYSNLGIGMLGSVTARSMGRDFTSSMEQQLFPALGMRHTYIDIPAARKPDYAQGYTKQGAPVRMSPGVLSAEAYGVKTTAADMIRFMQANMSMIELDAKLQRAVTATHTGYFTAGPMTQDLIWEQYPYPVALKTLLEGNSPHVIFNAIPATRITPPKAPSSDAWINKTGSTNGFGAYVAFVPEKRLGIVILANKNFPIEERVAMAYKILTNLTAGER
ncbi:beta-lactamase [Trinickia fusca]|uniref:Beta-lactamase n=1 Tax=Trinickia fusca TaxID=2419777 RepID=A0A494XKV7_9BURK|nr:beta-lactamase [Trinickia fusca]